ncbi:CsbD family protein [Methylocystis rosea]|uniref:CsbD family protein n=1 Tax=Methylocystis rosea TaxID=173366 RepID=UPI001FDF2902|nr:CsbD family protein [Methylocystis rosea]
MTNWNVISGGWKQFSGKVKEQWGRLTDDELVQINGKRESLEGMLQQKYGYTPDEAKREVDNWISRN